MLIRPPRLQFFKHGLKITATDTNYYQEEIKITISIKEVYKCWTLNSFFPDFWKKKKIFHPTTFVLVHPVIFHPTTFLQTGVYASNGTKEIKVFSWFYEIASFSNRLQIFVLVCSFLVHIFGQNNDFPATTKKTSKRDIWHGINNLCKLLHLTRFLASRQVSVQVSDVLEYHPRPRKL